MHTDDFDFQLPPELIAQAPLPERDASRLLHVRTPSGALQHRQFRELPSLLREGDLLVFNDSRVIPARLLGKKAGTGGKAELLLIRPAGDVETESALKSNASGSVWICLGQSSKGFKPGMKLEFDGELTAEVLESVGGGEYRVRFTSSLASLEAAIERAGKLPLPPYITRDVHADDANRYQTVFAKKSGSVAAPTAGLHFTDATFAELNRRNVKTAFVTLEVGPGTFLPVREGPVAEHKMHEERAFVPDATIKAISDAKRVIAVGTTVVRTLESSSLSLRSGERAGERGVTSSGPLSRPSADLSPLSHGEVFSTGIFITPGFEFRVIDALVTNFHLPKSTLVMLVSAFLGRENTLNAYAEAIREKYRFFSYGDSMFIESDS